MKPVSHCSQKIYSCDFKHIISGATRTRSSEVQALSTSACRFCCARPLAGQEAWYFAWRKMEELIKNFLPSSLQRAASTFVPNLPQHYPFVTTASTTHTQNTVWNQLGSFLANVYFLHHIFDTEMLSQIINQVFVGFSWQLLTFSLFLFHPNTPNSNRS